jgi:hypothetical protein
MFEGSAFALYSNQGVRFIDKLQLGIDNHICFVLVSLFYERIRLLWWNPHSRQQLPSPTLPPLDPSHHGLALLYHKSLEGI